MLEFNTALEKDVLVIELEGALDSHSATDFRHFFQEKIAGGYRAFALDFLCLEYISSAGISAIIDLQSQLHSQEGKMVLFQVATESLQLLRFLKLEDKLTFAADYDDAVAALTGYRRVAPEHDLVPEDQLRVIEKEQSVPAAAEVQVSAPAAPVATPPAATPEAQELKLHTGTKRLISCPNCKSVLRVAVAGDYLCPGCRFRFAFKPNT